MDAPVESKEELRAIVLKAAIADEADQLLPRRQSGLGLNVSTQIDEEGPDPTRIQPRRLLRMSADLGDFRHLSTLPRAGSWSGHKTEKPTDNAELMLLRAQLNAAQAKLAEVEEAKVASDTCLHALKEFISTSGQTGSSEAIKLPPLPTEEVDDDLDKPAASADRRPSLWNLAGFAKEPSIPAKEGKRETSRAKSTSPVLTEFNGWSVRRRASHASKDKPEEVVPARPTLASFESFSFGSRTINPALYDSPASPGGGLSPGGRTRSSSSPAPPNLLIPLTTPCDGSGRFPNLNKFEEELGMGQAL
jgi:hypothetical protein